MLSISGFERSLDMFEVNGIKFRTILDMHQEYLEYMLTKEFEDESKEREHQIEIIESRSMPEVIDIMQSYNIKRGSCSWHDYELAKRVLINNIWINDSIYHKYGNWIVNYIFSNEQEEIQYCEYLYYEDDYNTSNKALCVVDGQVHKGKPCEPCGDYCLIKEKIILAKIGDEIEGEKYRFAGYASYQEYLQSPHWLKIRQQALEHYDNACALDKRHTKWLNVHHNNYANLGKETMNDVIVLCRDCHAKFHDKEIENV